ncbi:MAG TPA: TetR/AcrR family transcriptional regulator [Kofleriaceae bacterium]|nr:TetR/AcrR family transcriptional regulator [Kofleriaceae bacterium]
MSAKSEQKVRTHGAILQSAERLLRERGIAGASVVDVMRGVGLTVGGFYAHFASKEKLIDTALRRTASAVRTRLFAQIEDQPPADRVEVVLKRYLSAEHRDTPDEGCPLPAVVGEVATTASEHREALAEQVDALAAELERHAPKHAPLSRRQLALGMVVLMYGGLGLARALRGSPLSDEILSACRALGRLAARADRERRVDRSIEPASPTASPRPG